VDDSEKGSGLINGAPVRETDLLGALGRCRDAVSLSLGSLSLLVALVRGWTSDDDDDVPTTPAAPPATAARGDADDG